MNNIHEKDWAEDDWAGHSGMLSNPYDGHDTPATVENDDVTDGEKNIADAVKKI